MLFSRRPPTAGPPATGPRSRAARSARRSQRLRWFLWRWRVIISAGLCALALTLAIGEVRPTPIPTRAVVVVRTSIPGGQEISPGNLQITQVPLSLIPDDAVLATSGATGRNAAVSLTRGMILTSSVLAGTELTQLAPPGTVVVPVRLTDAAITRFLNVGDHVDLVLVPEDGDSSLNPEPNYEAPNAEAPDQDAATVQGRTVTLAHRALVLPMPPAPNQQQGGLFDTPSGEDDGANFILVAVSPTEAHLLTASARSSYIGAVLVE